MRPVHLHRISAGLLAFFALSHTGGMLDTTSKGVAVDLVVVAMRNASFPIMGTTRTLYDFYFGFGMLVSVFLLLAAWVSVELATLSTLMPETAIRLGIAQTICLAIVSALCLVFFFPAPTLVSVLACLTTAIATTRTFVAKRPSAA